MLAGQRPAIRWAVQRNLKNISSTKMIKIGGLEYSIAKNGDVFLHPTLRIPDYLFIFGAGLSSVMLWNNGLLIHSIVLFLLCLLLLLILWMSQTKLRIVVSNGIVEWNCWFLRRQLSYADVSHIEILLHHQICWAGAHLAFNTVTTVVNTQMDIVLKDGSRLPLGYSCEEFAKDSARVIAEALARVMKTQVRSISSI
jgi:hypothetical protein